MKIEKLSHPSSHVDWFESTDVADYNACVQFMEQKAVNIRNGTDRECIWLVEHTPLYTGGTSAMDSDILQPQFPVHKSGRGGQYTYHGTGQRTVYAMIDLKARGLGIKEYVRLLEQWIIDTLALYNIKGERRCQRVGIWINNGNATEDKICAIGVRIKKWVSFHGFALNISPELQHFYDIIPCGITNPQYGVSSLEKLGILTNKHEVDLALMQTFNTVFPPIQ